eukprot:jgi/Psemu1/286369/fgenesh1_pg.131_\
MSDAAYIDAEMIAALNVLRGDGQKDVGGITKEYSNELISKIIDQLSLQAEATALQNAAVVKALERQTAVLKNLTKILETKQKTTIVVVNKDDKRGQSVGSTAAETEVSTITEDPRVIAAIEEAQEPPAAPTVVQGTWGFVESDVAAERRSRIEKSSKSFKYLPKDTKTEDIPADAFVPITNDDIVSGEDALFGHVADTGSELSGDSFGKVWESMKIRPDQYGKLKAPKWSKASKQTVRSFLPKLSINGETKIMMNSGIYYLTVKYENPQPVSDASKSVEAAIIIGEISFDCQGTVMSAGANWKKMMMGKPRQVESFGTPKWYATKACDPWKSGDILKFKIDTHTNTVGFTIQGPEDEEARAGWMFPNVLSITNKDYKKYLQVFAYCGGALGASQSLDSVKLTVIDASVNSNSSVSSISEGEEEAEAETETPAEEETAEE